VNEEKNELLQGTLDLLILKAVTLGSNPAFASAVSDQHAIPAQGLFLIIQEPVHEMNSRLVPKPEVRISNTVWLRPKGAQGKSWRHG
jgi:hypothetical protein